MRELFAGALLMLSGMVTGEVVAQGQGQERRTPILIEEQGSFAVGGTVITGSNGDTFHGDHAYVQYQIPANARALPLVMWHGGGQFSKTWESTPDGRDGFQTLFLKRGWSVYNLDQPGRGRAGRRTVGTTIGTPTPNESSSWNTFRLGIWTPPNPPAFFPNVQFPRTDEAIDQYWRQITPNTAPEGTRDFQGGTVAKLFEKIGAGILLTHSNSGQYGWVTAMKVPQLVKAIVAYEPAGFAFPDNDIPPLVATSNAQVAGLSAPQLVPAAEFQKLTQMPIQIIYGDNIEFNTPSAIFGVELWRVVTQRAEQFAAAINRRGGNVQVVHLPRVGLHGNTHFPFSDLNNVEVADLLSQYLREQRLERR